MPVNGLKYVTIEEKEVPMKENTITGSARRSGKKRIRWIDLARAFGILTVVLCHCVHEIYRLQLTYMSSLHRTGRLFGFAAFTAGRLGVPLFLMISGYLLLNRSYTADRCRYFFRHNFLRLGADRRERPHVRGRRAQTQAPVPQGHLFQGRYPVHDHEPGRQVGS